MCGQNVWVRLKRLNIELTDNKEWSEEELVELEECYNNPFLKGENALRALAKKLNRNHHNVCRKARQLGLTDPKRKESKRLLTEKSEFFKKWHS